MTEFTAKELEDYLESLSYEYDRVWNRIYVYSDINTPWGKVEYVANLGSGSGDGSWQAIVIRVGNRLFRKEGTYSSWDDAYWDGDFEEVEPYERTYTITDYRSI